MIAQPIRPPLVGHYAAAPDQLFPLDGGPTLDLRLDGVLALDPRVTFTRASNGTYRDSSGVLQAAANNVPRFDHDDKDGNALGLLLEESRQNILLHTEDFTDAVWVKGSTTITSNQIAAPDGATTADLVTNAGTTGTAQDNQGVTAGAQVATAIFVKNNTSTQSRLVLRDSTNGSDIGIVNINWSGAALTSLSDGTTVPDERGFEDWGDGWYRVWMVATMLTGGVSLQSKFAPQVGTATNSAFFWGFDSQEGNFPTSYIANTTSQSTRAADVAQVLGDDFANFYNPGESTLIAWFRVPASNVASARIAEINGGSDQNRISLLAGGNNGVRASVSSGGAAQTGFSEVTITPGTALHKIAVTAKANDVRMSVNGSAIQRDTSAAMPISPDRLSIGGKGYTQSSNHYNGHVARVIYLPAFVGDAVQALAA